MARPPIPPKQSGTGHSGSKRIEIEFVREANHEGIGPCFEVARLVTHVDGRTDRLLRVYPMWAIAARMAEYNVSQAEAVRMLIAEPHVERPEPLPPVLTDPLWRRGAETHRQRVEQTVARFGFNPLDARVEDAAADPTAVMRQLDIPDELVSALRLQVADQRQALRERVEEQTLPLPEGPPGAPFPLPAGATVRTA